MDNLAHTLVGAAMAEAGLKRKSTLATPTLMIASNLPDIDVLAAFGGTDSALHFRRGWTHGVLAWAVLPALLAGAVLAWDRFVRRRRRPHAEPVRAGWLVGLSYLGLLTHPFLDWLNTYGVRLLMPFDDRWFYGDALFIVDPWLWLLFASSVVLARSRSALSITGWALVATATSALIFGYAALPLAVKIAWALGVSVIVALRLGGWLRKASHRVAIAALAVASLYVATMISGAAYARGLAAGELRARGVPVEAALASPAPGNPLARDGLVRTRHEYYFFAINPLADPPLVETRPPVAVEAPGRVVRAALASPQIRGFRGWMRFPSWEVRRLDDGWRVILRDLRYADPDADEGFGVARIDLDDELEPRQRSLAH